MSCIITYKGQKYSEEQFKEYFINNKQEFTTSIAKNKDVIDSFKRKMEGIDFVFSQSPELASIGSKAQYLQYLSTIFKTSKVKDIVYHGTKTKEEFEKFITEREYPIQLPQFKGKISKGAFFTKDRSIADVAGIRTITAILNMKNPLYRNKGSEYLFKEDVEDIQKNNDSLIAPGNKEEFIVFEPEQIHILGSKQDIEGFKEFVNKPTTVDKNQLQKQNIKGIEINSYQTGLGNSLTNVHYAKNGKSAFDIIPSDKSLKLTQAAKAKWGESVEAWYKSNNAKSKGIPEGAEGDAYDMKLMVGLITDKLNQYPDLVSQITQRGGLGFLNKSTHTMGTGRWSSSNPKNMFMNVLKQAYQNASTQAPVSTEDKGNIQLELIEDLVQQGVAKTTVRNYDRPSGIYKSAKTENLYNLVNRGKVKMVGDKIVGKGISYTLDEFGAAEGFGNWAGFTKAAKYAGKDLIAGKEVFLYDITAAGKKADKARPVFDSLPSKSNTSTMTYAGIGSRQTPQEVLDKMTEVAKYLDDLGYTLNTGKTYPTKLNDYFIKTVHKGNKEAAEKAYKNKQAETERLSKLYGNTVGMDEEGADRAFSAGASKKNLFSPSDKIGQKEMKVGEEIHPNWSALSAGAAKLMARNTNQVFGENLDKPVDFVLFYAKEVKGSIRPEGGTGQAVEMARRKGIPTINMADENWRDQLKAIIKQRPTQQPLDFKTMPEFSLERKREILSNFAIKHGITPDQAYQYINQALNDPSKKKEDIIKKLKECY